MAINNTLQTKSANKEVGTISEYLGKTDIRAKLNGMLGTDKEVQKFVSSITSAVSTNPQLQMCTKASVVSTALLANAINLSLSPQLGLSYMVPFEDKKNKRTVATFILGYKGYIQLAIRSGYYKKINVIAIKEGELVSYDPLMETLTANLIQDDEVREQAPTIGYFAMFELTNGFVKTLYWSKKKMIVHADKYSKAFSKDAKKGKNAEYDKVSFEDFEKGKVPEDKLWLYSSYWYKDFDGMAFKTMLRQLISKWGIMSIDMQTAYQSDNAIINEDGTAESIENKDDLVQPIMTNETETQEQPIMTNESEAKEPKQEVKEEKVEVKVQKQEVQEEMLEEEMLEEELYDSDELNFFPDENGEIK